MPVNSRHQTLQTPASPSTRPPTAKYTNKDGTKTITVPKSSASTPPAQPSPTNTTSSKGAAPAVPNTSGGATNGVPGPAVNRKKQKRRAKAAAKAAAAEADAVSTTATHMPADLPSPASTGSGPLQHASFPGSPRKNSRNHQPSPPSDFRPTHAQEQEPWDEDDETESDEGNLQPYHNHYAGYSEANGTGPKSRKSKKKKRKQQRDPAVSALANEYEQHARAPGISKEKIWNTSSQEERERIKQFWLGLGEDERKSLVKVEKDAVLKKMKEQQKHTCSCTVCGRKRTAIEEELEGLYDAYYEELESFANQPHNHPDGPPMLGTPRRLGQMAGLHPPSGLPPSPSSHYPSRGRIVEHVDNDEEDEDDDADADEYSDDDDDLDDDDNEEPEEIANDYAHDFFNFGQSLTVQGMKSELCCSAYYKYLEITYLGGILTVADDLLKNDGKKFIEMMEQLAERRMAREEDVKNHYAGAYGHSVNGSSLPDSHDHAPPEEDDFDGEEEGEEDEYDSQEEEYDEEEVILGLPAWLESLSAERFSGYHDGGATDGRGT
jgi:hypothetical protein